MARLLLVRHGNTTLNSAERFWGRTDVALSEEGTWQAERLRDRLADDTIDAIYASPLSRTMTTAEIIASRHQREIIPCPELREIDFGEIEGLAYAEINERYPDFARLLADWRARPRFPGGESHDELNQRVLQFLPRLEQHQPGETILIVAHSGTLRLLICNLMEMAMHYWRQLRMGLASLSILDTYPQGGILNLLNDISHLEKRR